MPCSVKLRKGRISGEGQIYVLTTNIVGREALFTDWRVGRLVVGEFRRTEEEGWVESLAWVVMPDHFHWLVQLRTGSLATVMRRTKSRSSLAVNRLLGRSGQLWQRGVHDRAIRKEEDLLAVARYIVRNPVRAGLVSRVGDYPLWDAVWV
jgi:REP element-mobilizing transposase RayT